MAVVLVSVQKVNGHPATRVETDVFENKLKAAHQDYLRSDRSEDACVISHLCMRVDRYMFEELPRARLSESVVTEEPEEPDEREMGTSSSSSDPMPEYDIIEEVEID